jgi:hypothetical protein
MRSLDHVCLEFSQRQDQPKMLVIGGPIVCCRLGATLHGVWLTPLYDPNGGSRLWPWTMGF